MYWYLRAIKYTLTRVLFHRHGVSSILELMAYLTKLELKFATKN